MKVTLLALLAAALAAAGCSPREPATPAPAATAEPSLVGKAWQVEESAQVGKGDLRIFLADGRLVMDSANSTRNVGSWRMTEGKLTITEDGIDYPTDILELDPDRLRIRMHPPGEPVEMLLTPAPSTAFTGTVRFVDLEGGLWLIEADDGTRYQPVELVETFRKNGLRVKADALRRDGVMSIGMSGPLIEILSIGAAE